MLICPLAILNMPAYAEGGLKNYTLGKGIRFSNIQISGYTTIKAVIPRDGISELALDDLSLYMNARFNKFLNPFFEAEIAEAPIYVEGHNLFSGLNTKFVIERLYNDSHLTNNVTLRLGKSLDMVGEWNSIHAGPLVPTTTRPLTSYRSFSEFVTGASLLYIPDNEEIPSITFYWQPGAEVFKKKSRVAGRRFRDIKGLNLSWNWGFNNLLGLSFQAANVVNDGLVLKENQYLLGMNIHLAKNGFHLQSEYTRTWLKNPMESRVNTNETGIYIQGLYDINEKWAVFTRYEYFKDRDFIRGSHNALAGIKYNPISPMVWKLEYVKQWGQELNISTGIAASLSVLF